MGVKHEMNENSGQRFWTRLILWCFLAILAFFLITEHTAHVFGILPYLLLLACPLMHLFMHGGHGGHKGYHSHQNDHTDQTSGSDRRSERGQ